MLKRARALEQARNLAKEAARIANERQYRSWEPHACLALARVLLRSGAATPRADIQAALAGVLELVHDTGVKAFEPLVHVELADLARQLGEEEGRTRELREAHRLFTEIGAASHARRVASELAAPVA